jgi:hypothetical protein
VSFLEDDENSRSVLVAPSRVKTGSAYPRSSPQPEQVSRNQPCHRAYLSRALADSGPPGLLFLSPGLTLPCSGERAPRVDLILSTEDTLRSPLIWAPCKPAESNFVEGWVIHLSLPSENKIGTKSALVKGAYSPRSVKATFTKTVFSDFFRPCQNSPHDLVYEESRTSSVYATAAPLTAGARHRRVRAFRVLRERSRRTLGAALGPTGQRRRQTSDRCLVAMLRACPAHRDGDARRQVQGADGRERRSARTTA